MTTPYGWAHQQVREALLRALIPGEPCPRCWLPMWRWQRLDAAHPVDRGLVVDPSSRADHLEHAACNRRAGAEVVNAERRGRSRKTSRNW